MRSSGSPLRRDKRLPRRTLLTARYFLLAAAIASGTGATAAASPPPLAEETSDTRALIAISPHWIFLTNSVSEGGTRIVDGDSGKVIGTVPSAPLASFAIDPEGKFFAVAESIWTKRNRGTRQDLLALYNSSTLKLDREIPLPGRQMITFRRHIFGISADGTRAYVFNMTPATSAIFVDLTSGQPSEVIELPGCGLTMPVLSGAFASLCGNGTIAVTQLSAPPVTASSKVFFNADTDPVYDNSVVDAKTGQAVLLSYSGLVYLADLSTKPKVGAPWSIQEAAGLPRASTGPMIVNWLPGGREPMAVHSVSARMFVLMHIGEFWTHKTAGTELWVLDIATRKLVARRRLPKAVQGVAVSQDAAPLLFMNTVEGGVLVWDASTFEAKHEVSGVGNGIMTSQAAR